MQRLQQRLRQSFQRPTRQDWRQTVIVLAVYSAIALPIAWQAGLFVWSPWPASQFLGLAGAKLLLGTLILPAFVEEIIFRVMVLPHPSEQVRLRIVLLWLSISLCAFILSHPLNALTFFPSANPTFLSPVFLGLAGLLGFACSMLYRQTGSVWTIVTVHWLVVVVWLGLGGGEALLRG